MLLGRRCLMDFIDQFVQKWNAFYAKTEPFREKTGAFFTSVGNGIGVFWNYIVRLRKIFAAIPVAWAAVMLAIRNMVESCLKRCLGRRSLAACS